MKTYHLPPDLCPKCGDVMDAATGYGHQNAPKENDFTVCFHCAAILCFDSKLRLRVATADDLAQAGEDVRAAQTEIRRFHLLRVTRQAVPDRPC